MKLKALEMVGAEEWQRTISGASQSQLEEKVVSAVAVEIDYVEVARAGAVGNPALEDLFAQAIILLKSGAMVEMDKWLEKNGAQGLALSFSPPRCDTFVPETAAVRIITCVMATRGVQNFDREHVYNLWRRNVSQLHLR